MLTLRRQPTAYQCPGGPGINGACGGALWRVDTGMSKMMGGRCEVLEITTTTTTTTAAAATVAATSPAIDTTATDPAAATARAAVPRPSPRSSPPRKATVSVAETRTETRTRTRTALRVLSADYGAIEGSERMARARGQESTRGGIDDFSLRHTQM